MLAVLPPPPEPDIEGGLALSLTLLARTLLGVVTCVAGAVVDDVATIEFFRVLGPLLDVGPTIFFEARVDAPPDPVTGKEAPDPRLRFLMTSVFRESGRTTP